MAALPVVDEGGERCETCRFWQPNNVNCLDPRGTDGGYGYCRRYPPMPSVAQGIQFLLSAYLGAEPAQVLDCVTNVNLGDMMTDSPVTEDREWCGEWQAKKAEVKRPVDPPDYHTQRDTDGWLQIGFPSIAARTVCDHFRAVRGGATFCLYDLCSMSPHDFVLITGLGRVKQAAIREWLAARDRAIGDSQGGNS